MRLKFAELAGQLQQGLAPIYLISGDEPQQVMEALAQVRTRARVLGYSERQVFEVQTGFDWQTVAIAARSLSLFAERRLLELALPGPKPGAEASKALMAYAATPPADVLLLIQAPRLPAEVLKGAWVTAIDRTGVVVQVWPLQGNQLTTWLGQRMRAQGLLPEPESVQLLAERVAGNLPAAVQEIEKLRLLYGTGPLRAEAMLAAVTDNARCEVFDLPAAVFSGDAVAIVRVLSILEGEGAEPVLLNWTLTRELRTLIGIGQAVARGEAVDSHWARIQPLPRRQLLQQAWRLGPVARRPALLGHCARLDRVAKGQEMGNPWEELLHLCLEISGQNPVGDGAVARGE